MENTYGTRRSDKGNTSRSIIIIENLKLYNKSPTSQTTAKHIRYGKNHSETDKKIFTTRSQSPLLIK